MGGIRGQGNVTDSARSSHAASQRKRIRSMEPLNDSAHLTHASTKGGGGGGYPHTGARASRVQPGDRGGHPDQAAGSPSVKPGYRGGAGHPQAETRAPRANLQERKREREREREWGTPPEQEGEGMAPPKHHSALPVQGTWEREGGATSYPERRE